MKKSRLELKLESLMAEINKIKKPFISAGQKLPPEKEAEVQTLRNHIRNLEEMKKIIHETKLKSEKYDR